MRRVSVCTEPGCPNLKPCTTHSRNPSLTRNPKRDILAHQRWAYAIKKRDKHQCQRCGTRRAPLHAHHTHGLDDPRGITLCGPCHRAVDPHAR